MKTMKIYGPAMCCRTGIRGVGADPVKGGKLLER